VSILRYIILFLSSLIIVFLLITNHRIYLEEDILFDINLGSSLQEISADLEKRNLIISSLAFQLNAKVHRIEKQIKAGEYLLSQGESIFTLQKKFLNGQNFYRKLQLLEGMTMEDVFKLGNSEGIVDDVQDDLLNLENKLGIKNRYEGFLFPDTFYYQKGDLFSALLKRSFLKQQKLYSELWTSRQDGLPYQSLKEAITLASIIEKEGLEKKLIAGVFVNRLKKNMKLQSDPTVIYAMGNSFDGNIRKADLRIDNPYNTYKYKGLPPGPIGLVSLSSMKAALNPEKSDFLYFVSMNNGFHKFSKTLDEHNKAVLKYQINGR
tara:strand:- start:694 stop:1656 length:963 start_codon:yes stop_codon:yes gene_type:complete